MTLDSKLSLHVVLKCGRVWNHLSCCFVIEGASQDLCLSLIDSWPCLLAPLWRCIQLFLLDSGYCCLSVIGCFVDQASISCWYSNKPAPFMSTLSAQMQTKRHQAEDWSSDCRHIWRMCTEYCSAQRRSWHRWSPPCQMAGNLNRYRLWMRFS